MQCRSKVFDTHQTCIKMSSSSLQFTVCDILFGHFFRPTLALSFSFPSNLLSKYYIYKIRTIYKRDTTTAEIPPHGR